MFCFLFLHNYQLSKERVHQPIVYTKAKLDCATVTRNHNSRIHE